MKVKNLICIIFSLQLGCKPIVTATDGSTRTNKNILKEVPQVPDNYIVNASFSIKKINSNYVVDLVDLQKQKGRLKTPHTATVTPSKKHLVCSILDKNDTVLQSFTLPDPLLREVEYVNDTNHFIKRTIALDSATFTARFPLKKASKFISIHYVLENLDALHLKKIKL
ncbi:hypothetical protein ES676_04695 [Bizionia saleffrena]|uniref:Lipoprotein n=1 Tax=Bizionia saleffrena TaxID=291189 RepID=A0A8H2QM25_9FLAO|nr:hypothetical protein [Bizionia saleffrena]TYB76647.1 hypothetical protein ES676_04695 [Bizionia saleffrena]